MKILIADSFPDTHQKLLTADGHDLTFDAALKGSTLPEAIADHEVLIVRSTEVGPATLKAGTGLKLVIRAGAGTNTIDKSAAAELGIKVCNVPGANAIAVAELVMGLILSIDRNIHANVSDLHNGIWAKKKYSVARGLYGSKIGILGLGAIGFAVAKRASAFGMEVFSVRKHGRSEATEHRIKDSGITLLDSVPDLISSCDIVSLHLPATDATTGMVNSDFLAQMQDGAMLINTSRGTLIDETALLQAIESKRLRVGLDVYNSEPDAGDGVFTSKVANHPGVCGTHHIGASTEQAQNAVADGVIDIIAACSSGEFKNCVN